MTGKKARNILYGLIGVASLVFFALTFFGLSVLGSRSQAMVELKLKSAKIDAQLINLSQAKKDVEKYKDFNAIAETVIPKDKNQVQAIADIFKMADRSGILLQSVSFPNSTLGTKPAPTAASTGGQAPAAANTSTQSAISQAKPFSAVPGLYSLELTITPQSGDSLPPDKQVTYTKFINFLTAIENSRRTAQISNVTIQPVVDAGSDSDRIIFSLGINIFIKP